MKILLVSISCVMTVSFVIFSIDNVYVMQFFIIQHNFLKRIKL